MSKDYQYLKWNEISGNGLTSAVNSAAVATAGLAEANRDIAGLADKFTKLGQDISKTATERRDKALNEYSNNLFNDALKEATDSRGLVDIAKLNAGIDKRIAAGEAAGEYWGKEEVGNIIGKKFMENLNQITGNNLYKYKEDLFHNRWTNAENRKILDDSFRRFHDMRKEFSDWIAKEKPSAEEIKDVQAALDKIANTIPLWTNASTDDFNTYHNNYMVDVNDFAKKFLALQTMWEDKKRNNQEAQILQNLYNKTSRNMFNNY